MSRTCTLVSVVCALTITATVAHAEPLPPSVAAMIDAAAAGGDATALKTVVALAKKTNPASVAEIDAQVAKLNAKSEQARVEKLSHEKLLEGIKGEGQIGASNTTGNSRTTDIAVGLNLSKETLHWKNKITLTANYQTSNGVTSEEQYLALYEGNYKFTPRFYALGVLGWDRDTFSGYSGRYGASVGLGYKLIDKPTLGLSFEAGPAVRKTDYLSVAGAPAYDQTSVAGRVASVFSWTIVPNTVFTETASAFVTSGDNTINSETAITTKLVGALSARLSFLLQYDSAPPPPLEPTDTTTRLTLVYGF